MIKSYGNNFNKVSGNYFNENFIRKYKNNKKI